jgi:hypothetical protein
VSDDHAPSVSNRRAIGATCIKCGGTPGFTNLLISKRGDEIELDPHATGGCVIRLDESGARNMCETVLKWLG